MLAQCTIRRHQRDLTVGTGSDSEKGVISAPGCVEDGNAVVHAHLNATASGPLEDHDNGFGKLTRSHRSTNSFYEGTRRFWSIPPPSVWTRPDHVRRIDDKHQFRVTGPAVWNTSQLTPPFDRLGPVGRDFTWPSYEFEALGI